MEITQLATLSIRTQQQDGKDILAFNFITIIIIILFGEFSFFGRQGVQRPPVEGGGRAELKATPRTLIGRSLKKRTARSLDLGRWSLVGRPR